MVKEIPIIKCVYETCDGEVFESKLEALEHEFQILTKGYGIETADGLRSF